MIDGHRLHELVKKIIAVVGTGRCFRMVLHGKDRKFRVPQSLVRAVVQIDMRDLRDRRIERVRINRKSVGPQ